MINAENTELKTETNLQLNVCHHQTLKQKKNDVWKRRGRNINSKKYSVIQFRHKLCSLNTNWSVIKPTFCFLKCSLGISVSLLCDFFFNSFLFFLSFVHIPPSSGKCYKMLKQGFLSQNIFYFF